MLKSRRPAGRCNPKPQASGRSVDFSAFGGNEEPRRRASKGVVLNSPATATLAHCEAAGVSLAPPSLLPPHLRLSSNAIRLHGVCDSAPPRAAALRAPITLPYLFSQPAYVVASAAAAREAGRGEARRGEARLPSFLSSFVARALATPSDARGAACTGRGFSTCAPLAPTWSWHRDGCPCPGLALGEQWACKRRQPPPPQQRQQQSLLHKKEAGTPPPPPVEGKPR